MAIMAYGNCGFCTMEYVEYTWLQKHVASPTGYSWWKQNILPKIIEHILTLRKIWNQPNRWKAFLEANK